MLAFNKTEIFHKIAKTLFIIINYHQLHLIKNQMICLVSTASGQHFSHFSQFLSAFGLVNSQQFCSESQRFS